MCKAGQVHVVCVCVCVSSVLNSVCASVCGCVHREVQGHAGCHLRGRHKGVGVVDAQHVVEGAGQLKGGAPHRTPHIQCQCVALLACKACCWLLVVWWQCGMVSVQGVVDCMVGIGGGDMCSMV